MRKMKRYRSYIETRVELIGEIPEHWQIKRLKFLCKISTGSRNTEDRVQEGLYPFFVRSQTVERINTYSFDGEAILTAGDGVGVGKVFHHYEGKMEVHQRVYLLTEFRDIVGKLLFYYLRANLQKEVFRWNAKSTVDSLRLPMFQNFPVVFPKDRDEQYKVIYYIDQKTSLIEETIRKKQTLIELLQEERAALFNQAVTRGLNQDVKLKTSGVEWLGDVPKHWQVKKLKYLLSGGDGVKIGPFGSALKYEFIKSSGYKIYGQEHVIADDFSLGHKYIDDKKFEELTSYEIKPGDIVVTMMGTTGRCKVVPGNIERGIMDSHLTRLRLSEKYLSDLLALVIHDSYLIWNQVKLTSKGSIMEGLNSTIIKSLLIPIPPIHEQHEILAYLVELNKRVLQTTNKINREIQLLQEYRTALINEVVTGKRCVVPVDEEVFI
jgi:type I restriction enzyme S subunit